MKLLFTLLATIVAAVSLALIAHEEPGYVLIEFQGWLVEATVVTWAVVIVLAFFLFHYALRMILGLVKAPSGIRNWHHQNERQKANHALVNGLTALVEGKWNSAEKRLLRYAQTQSGKQGNLLNYLAAARAAQEQSALGRRDHYLRLAHQSEPGAHIAIGLTQADLQIRQNEIEPALATLRHLQHIDPKHTQVLKRLAKLYIEFQDWDHFLAMVADLRKRKVYPEPIINAWEARAYTDILQKSASNNQNIEQIWFRIPKVWQDNQTILIVYIVELIRQSKSDIAEPLIRNSIKAQWNNELVRLYGMIDAVDPLQQLSYAEKWLKNRETNAVVLLTLGRLCLRNRLWGKARHFLEASVGAQESSEAYNELGRLLETTGENDKAMQCYRSGLQLTKGCERDCSIPIALPEIEADTPKLLNSAI